jgi:hypothetical protein
LYKQSFGTAGLDTRRDKPSIKAVDLTASITTVIATTMIGKYYDVNWALLVGAWPPDFSTL